MQHPHLPYANFTTLANTKWLLQTQQLACIYFGNKFSVLVLLEVTGNILPLAGLTRIDWQIPHLAGMTEVTGNTLAVWQYTGSGWHDWQCLAPAMPAIASHSQSCQSAST